MSEHEEHRTGIGPSTSPGRLPEPDYEPCCTSCFMADRVIVTVLVMALVAAFFPLNGPGRSPPRVADYLDPDHFTGALRGRMPARRMRSVGPSSTTVPRRRTCEVPAGRGSGNPRPEAVGPGAANQARRIPDVRGSGGSDLGGGPLRRHDLAAQLPLADLAADPGAGYLVTGAARYQEQVKRYFWTGSRRTRAAQRPPPGRGTMAQWATERTSWSSCSSPCWPTR